MPHGPRFVTPGVSLAAIEPQGTGKPRGLVPTDGRPLLAVLVFSSECAHCETAARAWSRWLSAVRSDIDAVAITGDELGVGQAYAQAHGWQVQVLAVPGVGRTPLGEVLIARTPWLFLLDGGGRVLFEGHGSRLMGLDSAIAAHSHARSAAATRDPLDQAPFN
ncbi:MAG: hypothetical protein Q8P50_12565 [Bacillota bacterium]|nr:hypothetical protein [Bacillota bacterium]